ncbi:MAG TPA: hypothetical protein VF193_06220 [Steroidobacter sp.]
MADVEQRVAGVETRLDGAFALDARLTSLESDLRKLKRSSLRDWLQTLAPYVTGLIVAAFGFWIKDSVTLALQREQLDLEYVKNMRDLIKAFDEAETQAAADANAVALAMYGKHAIIPLVERLEGGDVAPIAAERGLRVIGSEHPEVACSRFVRVVNDRSRRFRWQTHKTMIKVIGQSSCAEARADLIAYRAALAQVGTGRLSHDEFAQRYSTSAGFDAESVASLMREIDRALDILAGEVQT